MVQHFERTIFDRSGITFEQFDDMTSIRNRRPNSPIVPMHFHNFYELTLILRGSCEHFYHGTRIPLLPGDLFLIPPDQPHAFAFRENISFCICQFDTDVFVGLPEALLHHVVHFDPSQLSQGQKRLHDIKELQRECEVGGDITQLRGASANTQGIIHLGRSEADTIATLLQGIGNEQAARKYGFLQMKRALLEQALTHILRAQLQQVQRAPKPTSWRDTLIDAVLTRIDNDLGKDVDFEEISRSQGITLTYFRTLFKNTTGFSPTEYVNRARILRALELLQTTDIPVSEIAMQVGIFDPNYFSRLFKKTIGYPPSYFKAVDASRTLGNFPE